MVVLAFLLGDLVFKQIVVSLRIEYGSEAPCVHGYPLRVRAPGAAVFCVLCVVSLVTDLTFFRCFWYIQ